MPDDGLICTISTGLELRDTGKRAKTVILTMNHVPKCLARLI